ncbi:MAG: phosphoribosylglycinamide formyltransferase [Bacteroidales bacterium]|nr:phosphoribosylglycinamide formyltransferase [Bacteroidales bacterium]
MKTIKLALFASGSGTNVQQITEHFQSRPQSGVVVDCVVYNRKEAYVAERAKRLGVPAYYMTKADFMESNKVLDLMRERGIDYIILAGFLLLVPANLLQAFPERIVNIHPALLPKFGGKGMYGHHVHEAVVAAGERETGITIHLVDEHFDHGRTLFQSTCPVSPTDTADDVAARIHFLEQACFPAVIENFVR